MSARLRVRGATSGETSNPGTGRPFGETPRDGRCWRKGVFARSARTRRPVGSASGRPCRRMRPHIGLSQRWCLMKCRGGCLEHKASPTRRDCPQQAVISKIYQIQSATSSQPKPRNVAYPSRLARSSARFIPIAFGLSGMLPARASFSFFVGRPYGTSLRNFDTEQPSHIAMSCNPLKAWKASLTCTPPLICTSALVPKSH